MYRIIKLDGTELGMTDSVLYIKVTESGSFTPCSIDEAIGVAFDSVPYNSGAEGRGKIIIRGGFSYDRARDRTAN